MQDEMNNQLENKELFKLAKLYSYDYIDNLENMDVIPSEETIKNLDNFDESFPSEPCAPQQILDTLHKFGSKATAVKSGGKYFGFVNGGILPVTLATKWLTDTWDQNSGLFVMSPIASKLEEVCEKWLTELFGFPNGTAAGFVSGSSVATICAITAARNELLLKQGYEVNEKGLFGAPKIRVVLGEQAHSSVWKALSILGIGTDLCEVVPTDKQGRIIVEEMPKLDSNTLVIAQAGNVTGGAFDPIKEICSLANEAGAWVHIDGAFGLWAAASKDKQSLVEGVENADSWSVDAHKTLNAPFDSGIVLCKNRNALVGAMQATGSYLEYSEQRDGMLYVPELSKRARSVELWAAFKYLGKSGIECLVDGLCENTKYFSERLSEEGFTIKNEVLFNQIVVTTSEPRETEETLKNIQISGKCYCSGADWDGKPAIRISLCSWKTSKKDIDECVEIFKKSRNKVLLEHV
ncbi:aspartate aminotransferase family protein [Bacillus thuringiensis serovar mexicanensis]|uniref:Aspartate aminotransferase family protein n=2 Tax=Bacillus TaxID=1386 RepID=A0A2C9YG31_BACTU|nr:Pyridoxal-dependent decarboxylase [Bacillus thuringiensis serovar monterrey BGSC 4AJ1]OTW52689.1 aspartate aminotransferase family protein [Bacillus thuringiensis serovar mexicanensis]OTX09994.1 aspartate aminotransferase family protein [Bacillus thuringiensis serovar monterrey]